MQTHAVHTDFGHAIFLSMLLFVGGYEGTAEPLGLSVNARGNLELRAKPFRGIGVNYYDVFVRTLETPSRTNFAAGFAELQQRKIPFARFSASGYWPADWGLYRTNRSAHFARLDTVVATAERCGLGLVPSLFWYAPTLPDLVGEPVSAWGNPDSRTIALMREYTREVILRYRNCPAIWAWEFGNEYNLPADLPNAADHRPATVPMRGTPTVRSAFDELTHDQIRVALREFAQEVRLHDTHRAIFSGNAFPRASAWHQRAARSWVRDSSAQWSEMLDQDNPGPIDTLTGRLYSADDQAALPLALKLAIQSRKPLFIGEFGVPGSSTSETLSQFRAQLAELDRQQVSLAALWVFDFEGQKDDWSVTATNQRHEQLEAIGALNERWRQPPPEKRE